MNAGYVSALEAVVILPKGHHRYSRRELSPHPFMPMPGVHIALHPAAIPPALHSVRRALSLGNADRPE